VVERYGGAYWFHLDAKECTLFDHLNPENGGSNLSDNVGKFLPMHAVFHGVPLLKTITLGR